MNRFPSTNLLVVFILFCTSVGSASAQTPTPEQKKMVENQQLIQHLYQVANNQLIRKELEIVDDQLKELAEIMKSYQLKQSKIMMEYRKEIMEAQQAMAEGDNNRVAELGMMIQEKMGKHVAATMENLESVLLPHQLRRLRQLAKQQMLKYQSGYGDEFGIAYALADELELTDEQKEKLKEVIEEAREEYAKKLERLKKSTREKIMKALPKDKREKYAEIIGEPYDFDAGMRSVAKGMQERAKKAAEKARQKQGDRK